MGLDQYATLAEAKQYRRRRIPYYEDSMNWPIGVNILTYRDGWKALACQR